MHSVESFISLLTKSQREEFDALPETLQQYVVQNIYSEDICLFKVEEFDYSFLTDPYTALCVYIETDRSLYIINYNQKTQEIRVDCNVLKSAVEIFLHYSKNYCKEIKAQIKKMETHKCRK